MCESKFLEYKETVTNTFLKTVSAFANYGTGEIKFGIKDDGSITGVNNAQQLCLDIENKINDSIMPQPDYTLETNKKDKVIVLKVKEGVHKPYLYKSKAYKRNDTSTIEVDNFELTRLILEGRNIAYESLKSKSQKLTFKTLEKCLKNAIGIKSLNKDILKTLELYKSEEGYNIAGELLADINTLPGIDIVKFGKNIDIILDRETIEKTSALTQYEKTLEIFRKYYCYEEIKGSYRVIVELIPEKAFREAVINALLHRTWDVNANIRIAMHDEKIEIMSPGSLPKGLGEQEYLEGQVSVLRNPIIGNVFFRLHLIERFGTGIIRINESYKNSIIKPKFEVYENSIKISLPVISFKGSALNEHEEAIFQILKNKQKLSSGNISKIAGFGKNKTINILKKLLDKGYIKVTGSGRGTKYMI